MHADPTDPADQIYSNVILSEDRRYKGRSESKDLVVGEAARTTSTRVGTGLRPGQGGAQPRLVRLEMNFSAEC